MKEPRCAWNPRSWKPLWKPSAKVQTRAGRLRSRRTGSLRGLLARRAWTLALVLPVAGCQLTSGPRRLEELKERRPGTPLARTVFRQSPGPGERPLAEIEGTLRYWSSARPDGTPRWEGALEPEPQDLYEKLLERIERGASEITLVAYRFDAIGMDELTLVDYLDERGEHVGFDAHAYHEISALPESGPCFVGYDDMAWWEYPQLAIDVPVYLAIGVKELLGEVIKSPVSAVDAGWLGTAVSGYSPLSPTCLRRAAGGFAEDWSYGWTALTWRFRVRHRHTPLDLASDLLGALPLVGGVFDHKSPPPGRRAPGPVNLVAIGQGIHSGGQSEQHTGAWEGGLRELLPDSTVITLPYRYGGLADTTWSIFNLSSGMGYDAAAQLVFGHGVRRGDIPLLVGFSGSVQRFAAATRVLRDAGIEVRHFVGIAGPVSGFSCAARSDLLLGEDPLEDPVLLSAHAVNFLFYPLSGNIPTRTVARAGGHHTPWIPHPTTRAPRRGYVGALEEVLR